MMRKPLLLALGLALAAAVHAAPASDASLDELLTITHASRMMDQMQGSLDQMLQRSMKAGLQDRQPTPAQQKVMDDTRKKLLAAMQEEMAWNKLRPMYLDIYRDTLSQEEVDGMIAFYKTPAGQAVINKMPLLMQKTMAVMQADLMPRLMQRVQIIVQESVQQMRAAGQKSR